MRSRNDGFGTPRRGRTAAPRAGGGSLPARAAGPGDWRSFGPLGPLTELVIRRLFVSDQVAAAKFGTGQPLTDSERERKELDRVRQDATSRSIDPGAVVAFFQNQMTASKVVQEGLFQRWTAQPEKAPTTRPDLGQLRLELDDITTGIMEMLVAAKAAWQLPPPLRRVRRPEDLVPEEALSRLDGLHRYALSVALQSLA